MLTTKIARTVTRLGMVRTVIILACINLAWAVLSNVLVHVLRAPVPFSPGWVREVALPIYVALVVTIPADIILIAIARSLTLQRDALDQLAHRDHLTGLPNRRRFEGKVTNLIDVARMDGVLMIIDVDWFKRINDTYGHAEGDRVLSELGALLREDLRAQDLIGRLGGEEFGLFLPHGDIDGALLVARRLRRRVAALQLDLGQGAPVQVTISLGIASTLGFDSYQDCYRAADAALYRAKETGRNRECVYGLDTQPRPRPDTKTYAMAANLDFLGEIS